MMEKDFQTVQQDIQFLMQPGSPKLSPFSFDFSYLFFLLPFTLMNVTFIKVNVTGNIWEYLKISGATFTLVKVSATLLIF